MLLRNICFWAFCVCSWLRLPLHSHTQIMDKNPTPVFLPNITWITQATWIDIPLWIKSLAERSFASGRISEATGATGGGGRGGEGTREGKGGREVVSNPQEPAIDLTAGIHAISHCCIALLPLFLHCDTVGELDTVCPSPIESRPRPPQILLFERNPGGLGLSELVLRFWPQLLCLAYDVISRCACSDDTGCPSCIQSASCHEHNLVTSKASALWTLKHLLRLRD